MAEVPASSGPMERFQAEAARLRGEVESLVKHARVLLHGEQRARLPPRPRNPQHAARDQELEEVLERTEWFRRENKRLRDELQGMEHRFVAGPTDPRERDPMELVNLLTERRKELQRLREAGQGLSKVAERQRRAEVAQNALTPEMQARLKRVKDEVDRQKNLNVKLQSDRLKAADARKAEEALLRQEEREYRNKAKLHKPVHKAPVGEAAVPRSLRKLRQDVDIITVALRQDEKRLKAEEHEEVQQVALARRQIEQLKESIAEKRLEAERMRGSRQDGDIENSQDPLPGDALPGASPSLARAAPSRPPALPHQARAAKARETPGGHRAGGLASEPWEMAAPDLAAELNSRRRPGSNGAADVTVETPPAGTLSPMRLKGRSSPSQLPGDMDEEEDEHSSTSKDLLKMAGITPSKLQEAQKEESDAVEDQPQREKTAFATVRPGKCPPIAEDEAERKEDDPLEGLPLASKDGPREENVEDGGKEEGEVGKAKQEGPAEEPKSKAAPAVERNEVVDKVVDKEEEVKEEEEEAEEVKEEEEEDEEVKEEDEVLADDASEMEEDDTGGPGAGGGQGEESRKGEADLRGPESSRAEEELAASKGVTNEDDEDDEEDDSSEESEEEAPKAQAETATGGSTAGKAADAVDSTAAHRRSSAVGVPPAAEEESEEYDEDEEDDDEEEEEEEEEEDDGEETDDQEEAAKPAAPSKEAEASEEGEDEEEGEDASESEEEESEEEGSSENKAEAEDSSSSAGTEDEAPEPSLPASAASSGMLLDVDLQTGHAGGSNGDDVLEEPEPEHEVPKASQHRPTSGSEAEVAAGTPPDPYVPSMPQKISSGLDDLDKGSSARGDGPAASEPDAAAGTALSLRS